MSAAPELGVRPTGTSDDDDDLDHFYCCNPELGLCGADLSDAVDIADDKDLPFPCVVCIDLEDLVCAICGA